MGLSTLALAETSECSEMENREGVEGLSRGLPRSQSERLLAVCKAHMLQERELQEKYHESVFATVEKVMRTSQSNQLKTLKVLQERETADVMRKLQASRHGEVYASFIFLFSSDFILLEEKKRIVKKDFHVK